MPKTSDKAVAGQSDYERALADHSTTLRPAPATKLSGLPLTTEEGYIVSRIDRPMKVSEVLAVSGLPEGSAFVILLNLLQKGALLLPGEGVSASNEPSSKPPEEFVFSSRDLNEDVDLDLERKKQILFLFNRRDNISHYRLLGISPNASDEEIRAAFRDKSRLYHPDTYFRKRLGSYKDRLDTLFHRVKEAHDTLTDPERRRKYEWDARRIFTSEEMSALVQREIDSIEGERRQKGRRAVLLKSRGFAKLTRARDAVSQGDDLLAAGKIQDAIQRYQSALEMDPRLEDVRSRLVEARKLGIAQRADLALTEARRKEDEGQVDRAVELLRKGLELDPTNSRLYAGLAGVILRAGRDLKEARSHVQRAVSLGDSSSATRLLHGEILLRLGQKKLARVELEAAANSGEAKADTLLKEC